MKDLYATTMKLVHVGGADPFDIACDHALQWAWRLPGKRPDLEQEPSGHAGDRFGGNGTVVSWQSVRSRSAQALEVRLRHPDGSDNTLTWQATALVTSVEGATRVTVRLGLDAAVHSLRPLNISLRAPSVVLRLMEAPLMAYAGEMQLSATPRLLKQEAVAGLIEGELEAEGRALPILVASSDVPVWLAEALARGLAGLLQVVRARDEAADDELRTALSPSGYTIPRGGLRLFWPGFGGAEGRRHRHPYWTAAQLRAGGRSSDKSVINQLVNLLAPISTGRVPLDAAFVRARQEALQERAEQQRSREEATRQRARRQREAAQRAKREARHLSGDQVRDLEDELADVKALLDLAESERDEANKRAHAAVEAEVNALEEAVEYSERVEALEAENSTLRKNIQAIGIARRSDSSDGADQDSIPLELETWEEIAEHLVDLEGPGFCLTDQAKECANGKGRYPYPSIMWRSMRALEDVGRAFNELGAELGMRFDQFAREQAGITVALQDDEYEDCWFEYEGKPYQRLPHVKIDDAKPANEVGRIYFALDSDGKRIIVDWFGTKPDRPETKRAMARAA